MLTFTTDQIKSLIPCSAKKDVRYYLQGALLEVCSNGDVHLVSTDGHILFAGLIAAPNVQWTEEPKTGPWQMIIPRDTLELAAKSKKPTVELKAMPDGAYMLGDHYFKPVDGRFPDWRRVSVKIDAALIEPGHYDPALLVRANDALKIWFGGGSKYASHLSQYGTSSAIMTGDNMTAFCIVMPWRANERIKPFTPANY